MRREPRPRLPLWNPTAERKRGANLARFIDLVNRAHQLDINTYTQLYDWSIDEIADFWAAMWDSGRFGPASRTTRSSRT